MLSKGQQLRELSTPNEIEQRDTHGCCVRGAIGDLETFVDNAPGAPGGSVGATEAEG